MGMDKGQDKLGLITDARVENLPREKWMGNNKLGDSIVHVKVDGGEEEELFRFYSDELGFSECEFIGLTRAQGAEVKYKKDVAWLRSPSYEVVR